MPSVTLQQDHIHSLVELKAATMACRDCPIGAFAAQSVIGAGNLVRDLKQARKVFSK